MLCVISICVLKIMHYVVVFFIMQQFKPIGLIAHLNKNLLDLFKKVILDGTSPKDSCLVPQYEIETLISQPDTMQRLASMVKDMTYSIDIQL